MKQEKLERLEESIERDEAKIEHWESVIDNLHAGAVKRRLELTHLAALD